MRRAKQTAERGGAGTNRLQVTWIQSIFRKVWRKLTFIFVSAVTTGMWRSSVVISPTKSLLLVLLTFI